MAASTRGTNISSAPSGFDDLRWRSATDSRSLGSLGFAAKPRSRAALAPRPSPLASRMRPSVACSLPSAGFASRAVSTIPPALS
jgi:hypothetical protein